MSNDSRDEAKASVKVEQDEVDATEQQWKPTKPTDEETKAGIRKVFMDVAVEKNLTDQEYLDYIDNAVEEMFVIMKKSFG